jgi:hypothetical protein
VVDYISASFQNEVWAGCLMYHCLNIICLLVFWDSSASKVTGYKVNDRGSILGRDKDPLFHTSGLGTPRILPSVYSGYFLSWQSGMRDKLTTHLP